MIIVHRCACRHPDVFHSRAERNEMKAEMATKAEAARKWERMAESSCAERDALRRKLRKANKHRKRLEARADKLADELDLVSRGWEARVAARDKRHEEHSAVAEERDQLRLKVAEQSNQCDAMSQMLRRMARKRTADRGMARLSLSYWTSARDSAVEQRDKLRDEMVSALGLPPMSNLWEWGYAHKVVIDRIKKLQSGVVVKL